LSKLPGLNSWVEPNTTPSCGNKELGKTHTPSTIFEKKKHKPPQNHLKTKPDSMITKESQGAGCKGLPAFAILATSSNNRRGERESSSHKAKKSTEKSSGAASESVPSLRHPFPKFSPHVAPRDDDARSFQGPPPPPRGRPSLDRRLRQRRGCIARAAEEPGDGVDEGGEDEARVRGRCSAASEGGGCI
jgi:hypothetical protein